MKKITLQRISDNGIQTVGNLEWGDFTCYTLERPYLNNANNISAIPTGTYTCNWTRSNRLSNLKGEDVFTYEVLNVPNRSGIRIHSANYYHDLKGCIALGLSVKDIDTDGEVDLLNSRIAITQFNTLMNKEDFELTITKSEFTIA